MIRTVSLLSGLVLLRSYPAVGQEAAASRETSSQLSGSQLGTLQQKTDQNNLGQGRGLHKKEWTRYKQTIAGAGGLE
ncbi:TIGR03759 family integrating conjugative element protein, partial [Pseudomonas aeruginosa]